MTDSRRSRRGDGTTKPAVPPKGILAGTDFSFVPVRYDINLQLIRRRLADETRGPNSKFKPRRWWPL